MASVEQNKKKEDLENYLKELGSVAVAFSGGVDSTFLLKVAPVSYTHLLNGERQ